MEELNGMYSNRNRGKTEKDGDFEEGDVWGFVNERDSFPRGKSSTKSNNKSMIQKSTSSPVKIPELSKNSNNKKSRRVSCITTDDGSSSVASAYCINVEEEEEEEDYGDGVVPPHEYIARRSARNQIASFSMMEGVGRTLKGRDLSKLRNAILTKTGFLE